MKVWSSEERPDTQYNSWLREQALSSRSTLEKNTAKLRLVLQVLESVTSQEGTTSVRFARISAAMVHLITEIHLLVTLTEQE